MTNGAFEASLLILKVFVQIGNSLVTMKTSGFLIFDSQMFGFDVISDRFYVRIANRTRTRSCILSVNLPNMTQNFVHFDKFEILTKWTTAFKWGCHSVWLLWKERVLQAMSWIKLNYWNDIMLTYFLNSLMVPPRHCSNYAVLQLPFFLIRKLIRR